MSAADDFETADAPLCPNKADIAAQLYALFAPPFVHPHPDAWIEIAYGHPDTKGGAITEAQNYSAFELKQATEFAEAKNRLGFNIYVGPALRQGKRCGRASGANILTASHSWAEFDKEGDEARITALLQEKNLQTAMTVVTGRTPHLRAHLYFKLAGSVTPDELRAVNTALKTLLGCDAVQNPDRIMRLAGTVNYPTKDKRERGYVAELVTLRVREGAPSYTVEQLTGLAGKPSGTSGSSRSGRTDAELRALLEASRVKGQWHNSMLAAIATMIGRDWSDAAIKFACASYCRGGADDPDLVPMIEGAREKWNKPDEEAAASGLDDAEIERLARLPLLEYDQQRKEAAGALGVRVSMLDRIVGAARDRFKQQEDDTEIAEINAEYALVLSGNKASVMKFEDVTKFRLLQVGAFKQWFANQSITIGKKVLSVGEHWLSHPQRRQYEGIEFEPSGGRPGYYNLWQGLAVKPKEGDCSKFLAHLKDNAARGDEKTYLWIVGWFAQILQQPTVKMETALVLRGQQGTGKSKIGQVMGALIGDDHYISVASPRFITGQFNSHMASLLMLHADEAFWAGDKKSEGTLKDLVTGLYHLIEFKHVDPIRIKNYIRLFVTGNPDWLIPAGFKERRWAVFDMGEEHIQDTDYFAAIDHEMNNGGREALLHHLLNFNLSQVNLRSIPMTAALLDQQIESLNAGAGVVARHAYEGGAAPDSARRQREGDLPEAGLASALCPACSSSGGQPPVK